MSEKPFVLLIGLVTITFLIAITVSIVTGYSRREHRDERRTTECQARGGTVRLDRYNNYDGCLIGPIKQGG